MKHLARVGVCLLLPLLGCITPPAEVARPIVADDVEDVAQRLAAIPGMTVEERAPPAQGFRHFVLTYVQPVDHQQPSAATFTQRIMLVHHDEDAPVVIDTAGYFISPERPSYGLLAVLLGGNKVVVEHRYFGGSVPDPADFSHLNIRQAAADHHRVIQALRAIYAGSWISTGASKGGMTATYHRRFYPDDVQGTVANVAPLTFGGPDPRYLHFLRRVGDSSCRAQVLAFQRMALTRRATLAPKIDELMAAIGDSLTALPGGADQALDLAVGEFGFQFWQYAGSRACPLIPGPDATDDQILEFLDAFDLFFVGSDRALALFGPYYYQSVTEEGFPRLPTAKLQDLLHYDPNDYGPYVAAYGEVPPMDLLPMIDIAVWSLFHSSEVVFVYGEEDPWTAGAYPILPNGARDVHRFTVAGGTHSSNILGLTAEELTQVTDALTRWTGTAPQIAIPTAIASPQFLPTPRSLIPDNTPLPWPWTETPSNPRLTRPR